jgi:hypothetical protein
MRLMADPLTDPLPPRTPENYQGQAVCARCGDGWPTCAQRRPNGTYYRHQEACAVYRIGDWFCVCCTMLMEYELTA